MRRGKHENIPEREGGGRPLPSSALTQQVTGALSLTHREKPEWGPWLWFQTGGSLSLAVAG